MTTDAVALPAEQLETRAPGKKWNLAARIGFRFAFCYWVLYCLPILIGGLIPWGHYFEWPFDWFWHSITPWTARYFFHLSGARITYFPTGSGDTTLDYVQNLLVLVFAILGTLIWTLLDRKREEYKALHGWLRLLVRFSLALILFGYGIAKIIPVQFIPPSLTHLAERFGDASPMGFLWTFMGASTPYTIFGGLAEAVAATLLLFRRTALLGALIAAGVLLNVVMLNFCYDVPVKLYSTNLLLMAVFLLLPDISRLANVFVFNRTARSAELTRPHLPKRWMRFSAKVVTLLLFMYFVAFTTWADAGKYYHRDSADVAPPIYGTYDVDALSLNGKPALPINAVRPGWKQVTAGYSAWVVQNTDGAKSIFAPRFEKEKTVYLYSWETRSYLKLNYAQPDAQHLVLTGHLADGVLEVHLHRTNDRPFLLTSRGFHWISEQPFNR